MADDLTRRRLLGSILTAAGLAHPRRLAAASSSVSFSAVPELQPLVAQVKRLVDAMAYLGEPFADAERGQLDAAANVAGEPRGVEAIQKILDPRCLLVVRINPESRISIERGAAAASLVEHGWRAFLIKVRNEAGATGVLNAESPQARPVYRPGTGLAMAPRSVGPADIAERWLATDVCGGVKLPALSIGERLAEIRHRVDETLHLRHQRLQLGHGAERHR